MNEKNLLVVSINDYSMNTLKEKGFYATKSPIKEGVRFIAFYQIKPIQAITYYGEIKSIEQKGIKDIGTTYWLMNLPDKEPPYNVIKFKSIKKLKNKIIKDGKRGVQGSILININKLKNIKFISELYT